MYTSVNFIHLGPSRALQNYAQKKIKRVAHYLGASDVARFLLSKDELVNHAEINTRAYSTDISSHADSEDMYTSIDLAVEKLEHQLRRHHDRLITHRLNQGRQLKEKHHLNEYMDAGLYEDQDDHANYNHDRQQLSEDPNWHRAIAQENFLVLSTHRMLDALKEHKVDQKPKARKSAKAPAKKAKAAVKVKAKSAKTSKKPAPKKKASTRATKAVAAPVRKKKKVMK